MKAAIIALCLALFAAVALANPVGDACSEGCNKQCDAWKYENTEIDNTFGPLLNPDAVDVVCRKLCVLICGVESKLTE